MNKQEFDTYFELKYGGIKFEESWPRSLPDDLCLDILNHAFPQFIKTYGDKNPKPLLAEIFWMQEGRTHLPQHEEFYDNLSTKIKDVVYEYERKKSLHSA